MTTADDWRTPAPLFIDFEASSTNGWPIEVGWAEVTGGDVVSEGHLIRPEPEWDEGEWDELAEQIHGIPLARLQDEGRPAPLVADRMMRVLRGRLVVSDAGPYDAEFLRRLLDLCDGDPNRPVLDLVVLLRRLPEDARTHFRVELARRPPVHRAAGDAERLAWAWKAALEALSTP